MGMSPCCRLEAGVFRPSTDAGHAGDETADSNVNDDSNDSNDSNDNDGGGGGHASKPRLKAEAA